MIKSMIMKNLKIKLGLLSLLAILAVSVFLTSCEQETIFQEQQLTQDEIVAKMQNDSDVINLQCDSCGETSREEQLAAFQTMLDQNYLRGDCSNVWSWDYAKYAACVAHCAVLPLSFQAGCRAACYVWFCT